jgi:hypothetical protein
MGSDLEEVLEQHHRAVEAVLQGDPSPEERLWSRNDEVTLANASALRGAISQLSDGEALRSERTSGYSGGDLAYTLEIERSRVTVGGAREAAASSLRVPTIFSREQDGWKI